MVVLCSPEETMLRGHKTTAGCYTHIFHERKTAEGQAKHVELVTVYVASQVYNGASLQGI